MRISCRGVALLAVFLSLLHEGAASDKNLEAFQQDEAEHTNSSDPAGAEQNSEVEDSSEKKEAPVETEEESTSDKKQDTEDSSADTQTETGSIVTTHSAIETSPTEEETSPEPEPVVSSEGVDETSASMEHSSKHGSEETDSVSKASDFARRKAVFEKPDEEYTPKSMYLSPALGKEEYAEEPVDPEETSSTEEESGLHTPKLRGSLVPETTAESSTEEQITPKDTEEPKEAETGEPKEPTDSSAPSSPKTDKPSSTPESGDETAKDKPTKIYKKTAFVGGMSMALVSIVALAVMFAFLGKRKSRKNKEKKKVAAELGLEETAEAFSKSKSKRSTLN